MTDDVEAALRDLATKIHVPEPPDLTARVHAKITAPKRRNPLLAIIVALVTAFAVAVAVSPAVRAGVVEILRFAGIEFRSQPPPTSTAPISEREVSLDEVRRIVPFEIHIPEKAGPPDKVTVYEGRFVTLHYKDFRLDQFDGTIETSMAKILAQSDVEKIGDAIWIPRPHAVYYIDRKGEYHTEIARGTGKTLIWQRGEVTLRLQGDLTKERALEISAS